MFGLSTVKMYVAIGFVAVFVGIIGTQFIIGKSKDRTIDKLSTKLTTNAAQLVIKESENKQCHAEIEKQNCSIAEWKKKGNDYEIILKQKQDIIDALSIEEEIVLIDLEGQFIPDTCEGAMGWMIEKAQGELK